ncbi:MAG: glycerate kinase [Cyanobacteriota bacterium]|nr:glycerate kinase [Cyanobacteriota bacterium]
MTNDILQRWSAGEDPTLEDLRKLLAWELADARRAIAFGITAQNGLERLERRSRLFQILQPEVAQLCQKLGFSDRQRIQSTLWTLWLPLSLHLVAARQALGRPLIQGILGVQGTGKSTLGAVLGLILGYLGYPTLGLSLDDLYKTYEERQQLQQQNPRLRWRGPPGTHDVDLGLAVLDNLRNSQAQHPIFVPRFNKSAYDGAGDRTASEEVTGAVEIVLFEGWFVGFRPLDPSIFETAPPPIVTPEDRVFARESNERLQEYLPLWERLDRLLVLYPVDYRASKQWRKEAEQRAIASGKSGMSDAQIEDFVEYFWKALHPELFLIPAMENADWVIEVGRDRTLGRIYQTNEEN